LCFQIKTLAVNFKKVNILLRHKYSLDVKQQNAVIKRKINCNKKQSYRRQIARCFVSSYHTVRISKLFPLKFSNSPVFSGPGRAILCDENIVKPFDTMHKYEKQETRRQTDRQTDR